MDHNIEMLTRAAQLAEAAYNDTIPGAQKFENKRTSTTAFLIRNPQKGEDWVVWRGTSDRRDWLFNFLLLFIPVKKAWIHLGFYLHHRGIWKEIRKELNPANKTVFVGHSLAGACAEISAHLCREFRDLHLIALGKPNVFSRFKKCPMDHLHTFYSLVHASDLVARIPRYGYRPSSGKNLRQLFFSNTGEDYINPPRELKLAEWSVAESVADHMMTAYRQRTTAFCNECLKSSLAANGSEMKAAVDRRRKRKKRRKKKHG